MKIITIILTLSKKEFDYESMMLSDYIRELSDQYIDRGIYFKLVICDEDDPIDTKLSEINDSQFFYILMGKDACKDNIERFNIAYNKFLKDSNNPKIYPYFKILSDGESPSEEVRGFIDRLRNELGHYYSKFSYLDSIKLNMLLELSRSDEMNASVKFEDGKAKLDGKEIISLENIPFYSKNESLQKLIKERDELNCKFSELIRESSKRTGDLEFENEISTVASRKTEIGNIIRQIENDMLGLYSQISSRANGEERMTWREIKAAEMLDDGDYDGALAVLRDAERENELNQAEKLAEEGLQRIEDYISENKLRIKTLSSRGITEDSLQEIIECYEKIVQLVKKHKLDLDVVIQYVEFANEQKMYGKSVELSDYILNCIKADSIPNEQKYRIYRACGAAYLDSRQYSQAELCLNETLCSSRKICEDEPNNIIKVASAYHVLGSLYQTVGKYNKALECLNESLNIVRNYDSYKGQTAQILLSLGILENTTGHIMDAETHELDALEIYKSLNLSYPGVYDGPIVTCLLDLLSLSIRFANVEEGSRLKDIEMYRDEALASNEKLIHKNPLKYKSNKMGIHVNMGTIYYVQKRYDESKKELDLALELVDQLAMIEPKGYLVRRASIISNIGIAQYQLHQWDEAIINFKKALELLNDEKIELDDDVVDTKGNCFIHLSGIYANKNEHEKAVMYFEEGVLLYESAEKTMENKGDASIRVKNYCTLVSGFVRIKNYDKAEEYCLKAIGKFEEIDNELRDKSKADLAFIYFNLGYINQLSNHKEEAIKRYNEALEICNLEIYNNLNIKQLIDSIEKNLQLLNAD